MRTKEILESAKGVLIREGATQEWKGFSIDSRRIKEKDFFIPIIGENFDGHDFISSALENGAAGLFIQEDHMQNFNPDERIFTGKTIIQVEDSLKALQMMAKEHMIRQKVKCIGITGSVGKTTTKDFVAAVLGEQKKVLKTKGNFNNEIGLPLTLLDLDEQHSYAVLEMGMSSFGEIKALTEIAPPELAVITNIGTSHIEFLETRENIREAKMEITSKMGGDHRLLLNGDDPLLWALKYKDTPYRKFFYGLQEHNDFHPVHVETKDDQTSLISVMIDGKSESFYVPVPGEHQIQNALAAIWIGRHYGMSAEKIREGLSKPVLTGMRFEKHMVDGICIINDAYNASPESMIASIKIIENMRNGRRYLVLGDILELGTHKEREHYRVGTYIGQRGFDGLITYGEASRDIGKGAVDQGLGQNKWRHFTSSEDAAKYLVKELKEGDQVLFKASRGLQLEKIIDRVIRGRKSK